MKDITVPQMRVLACIANYIEKHGYAPTVREVADEAGYKSNSSVYYNIQRLIDAGFLETDHPGCPRALRLSPKYVFSNESETRHNGETGDTE